jgi:hypothetical protein
MQLLFQRAQATGPSGIGESLPFLSFLGVRPKFKLWAKVELEPDEKAVLDHYHFDESVLIDSVQPELIRKTLFVAGFSFIAATLLFWMMFSFGGATFFALIVAALAGYFYYDSKRETIFVRDLLHGRYFSCGSVVDLARKEAWLETVTGFLRQVMESAKNWGGAEAIRIEPLPKDLAKQIIIKGL